MIQLLPERVPWYIVGPLMGLMVVALYALANRPLGVTASYVNVAALLRNRPTREMWRVWFFVGLFSGALLAALLRSGPTVGLSYGALGALVPLAVLIPILFIGGVLMGYGARWGGGCTSGHGLTGSASLSPASLVATATFMATAVVVTFILHFVTGGAL